MENLSHLLRKSQYTVVFTGAGVSTLSGIRDFRGKNGIYKEFDADKIFDIDYFVKDPTYFYKHSKHFIYNLDEKQPSLVHQQCARLEQEGIVKAIITQNIDMLHQKAGSKNVIEVHGTPTLHHCLECRKEYTFDEISDQVKRDKVPYCDRCNGIIKPDITFFGEMLDETALMRAQQEASRAELMLVLGSSLVVHPAATIPLFTLDRGGKLAIINDGPTHLDSLACCRYNNLETCFQHIADSL